MVLTPGLMRGAPASDALAFPGLPFAWNDAVAPNRTVVLHEDFSTYSVIGDLGVNDRVDGGVPWSNVSSRLSLLSTGLDPWFGQKKIRCTVELDVYGSNCGFSEGGGGSLFENHTSQAQSSPVLVYQHAWRCNNGHLFRGKGMDSNIFTNNTTYRWVDETWDTFRMGDNANPSCDADLLCNAWYSNNGHTPRYADEPSSVELDSPMHFLSATVGGTPRTGNFIKQNVGASFGEGILSSHTDGTWYLTTVRLTMTDDTYGRGRYESWFTNGLTGTTWKTMEHIGELGYPAAGLIDTPNIAQGEFWVRASDGFGSFHLFFPSRNDNNGGWGSYTAENDLGGFVFFVCDKLSL